MNKNSLMMKLFSGVLVMIVVTAFKPSASIGLDKVLLASKIT